MEQQEQKNAAKHKFKEFTGSQNDREAQRLLEMCGWDLQRAINIFFTRGAKTDEPVEEVEVTYPPIVQRISHFSRRKEGEMQGVMIGPTIEQQQNQGNEVDESVQVIGSSEGNDSDIQMLDDNGLQRRQNGRVQVGDDGGEVRAPIPAVKGVMLAQSYRDTYQNGRQAAPSPFFRQINSGEHQAGTSSSSSSSRPPTDFKQQSAVDKYHQQKRNQQQSSSNDKEIEGATEEVTGGFGQASRRDLRILFRPPVEMIFFGDWDQALQAARQKNVWMLVNVQHSQEFASAALNRDIWSSETVREIVQPNFLFWQVYHDSSDGVRIRGYYGLDSYPAIFIVDPRTGEEVGKLAAPDTATFLDHLTTFLVRYPTFEARDREFREKALQRKILPSSNDTTTPITDSISTTSVAKKRKQPGVAAYSSGDEQEGIGEDGEEADENVREANRQAKKMKRVVTISDAAETQPSTSSAWSSSTWSSPVIAPTALVKIELNEWQKWVVAADSAQTEIPRVHIQIRLPNGQRQRHLLWAQTPLKALFSLIAALDLDPYEHQLVLDFPRREINPEADLLGLSLRELGFGHQETVNIEKRIS